MNKIKLSNYLYAKSYVHTFYRFEISWSCSFIWWHFTYSSSSSENRVSKYLPSTNTEYTDTSLEYGPISHPVGVRSAGHRHRSFEMKIANGWPKYDVFWRSIERKIATIVQRGTICRRSKEIKIAVAFAPVIFAKPNFFCFFVTNYLPQGTTIINPKRS